MKLIGIAGKAGSGKDTLANLIAAALPLTFTPIVLPLAGALKDMVCAGFGWTRQQLENREFKEADIFGEGLSPRKLMQTLGTEWGRSLREDFWLQVHVEKRIQANVIYPQHNIAFIVPDVRFDNEAEHIREYNGYMIHIKRPDLIDVLVHSSELGVTKHPKDIEVSNDGTILDLACLAREVVGEIL